MKYGYISFIACVLACAGDFAFSFLLGLGYPGYDGFRDSMSLLGSPGSPVSQLASLWWVTLCILMIIFAVGFRKTFGSLGRPVKLASWLIIIYGLCEGLGSALFPLARLENKLTCSALVHVTLGSIGDLSLLVLPLVIGKVFTKEFHPRFKLFSILVVVMGTIMIFFFIADHLFMNENSFFVSYKGLWQRLFLLDYYAYLTVVASWMIRPVYIKAVVKNSRPG